MNSTYSTYKNIVSKLKGYQISRRHTKNWAKQDFISHVNLEVLHRQFEGCAESKLYYPLE
jgi:hypothetical protein